MYLNIFIYLFIYSLFKVGLKSLQTKKHICIYKPYYRILTLEEINANEILNKMYAGQNIMRISENDKRILLFSKNDRNEIDVNFVNFVNPR